MGAINKRREQELVAAGEKALQENGYKILKIKFKRYTIQKDGVRQNIIMRTSTDRNIGFMHDSNSWPTLSDPNIDAVVIVAYREARDPSETVVYPPIPRAALQPRFDQARAAYIADGHEGRRVWVGLDRRTTGTVWDTASGIVADIEPLARYSLNPELELRPEPQAEGSGSERIIPGQRSVSMAFELNEEERRPRRLLIEVRLTFV
jgi:hypothetical protein